MLYYRIQYLEFAMVAKIFIHSLNILLALWNLTACVLAGSRYMHAFC